MEKFVYREKDIRFSFLYDRENKQMVASGFTPEVRTLPPSRNFYRGHEARGYHIIYRGYENRGTTIPMRHDARGTVLRSLRAGLETPHRQFNRFVPQRTEPF